MYIYMAVCTVSFSSAVLYSMLHLSNTTEAMKYWRWEWPGNEATISTVGLELEFVHLEL